MQPVPPQQKAAEQTTSSSASVVEPRITATPVAELSTTGPHVRPNPATNPPLSAQQKTAEQHTT